MKPYNIAVYIRLSMADEDTGRSKAESDSVVNQRSLIGRFLDCHDELSKAPRTEFCDDGYTGTNTNRPAFTDMMNRVKRGEFNLICVKDFSRFSRDYIEIGDCLECLFPFLGVRFISVNDNYDSDAYKGTTGGLDIVMRNIVYAAYSRDLSVKTTSAKVQLMKQGKYVGGYAPYGYVIHPTVRNKLVVDPEPAQVIRRIFRMAIDGMVSAEIARTLNGEQIPTPAQYFIARHPDTNKFSRGSDKPIWTHAMIHKILNKLAYTGAAVGHERKIASPLSRHTKLQPIEDRIIVEGVNEPIVSREEYDMVQSMLKKRPRGKVTQNIYPLKSLVRCGSCGRMMTRRKNSDSIYCAYETYDPNSELIGVHYSVDELESYVLKEIRGRMPICKPVSVTKQTDTRKQTRTLTELQSETEKLKSQKLKLYERYASGEISKEAYLVDKQDFDEKLAANEAASAELERYVSELEANTVPLSSERSLNPNAADVLTYDLAHDFIKAVYVYSDHTKIEWKNGV